MAFFHVMQRFCEDLRREGIPVTPSHSEDCFRALSLIDWSVEDFFYSSLFATLIKDYNYKPLFDNVYKRYFKSCINLESLKQQLLKKGELSDPEREAPEDSVALEEVNAQAAENQGSFKNKSTTTPDGRKNPLAQDFRLDSLDDVRRMEALFPLIAKRLASKMIIKNKRNDQNFINFRRTMRKSMSTGGIPVDLITRRKQKEKPVLFCLCDVSVSVLQFSCFALALLASLEKFFQHVRSFGFVDEIDEITHMLKHADPKTLRANVLKNAKVIGIRGYSNYGISFKHFFERYGGQLSQKTTVLIFGDGRNNWYDDEAWVLKEMRSRSKKIYWFNPEEEENWFTGDSRMKEYLKYCDRSFEVTNLLQMEDAFCQL
jgi:uncharacterized protein with von Willebrand factor type A (vWA) domain